MELSIGELINEKWKVEELFGESGQGQSARVSSVNNAEEKYVLKMLKDTGNSTNVKRFEQEIRLLKKMQVVERVPNVIDQNMELYYYVMDYIPGCTMETAIHRKENRRKFDRIMTVMMQLLEIVKSYTDLKIIHRDIKPGNIICRNGDIEDIFLIDFGIGYDQGEAEDLTEFNVQLGNRFLRLPELQNGNKRDIRSDITMCVGILFFLLTGSPPVSLLDENQRMPHETEKGIVALQWVGSRKLAILNKVFDKGFRYDIQERYQNISDLIFALNEINRYEVSDKRMQKYLKKTDSFCLDTIKGIMNVSSEKVSDALRRLKMYEGSHISIGNVYFDEKDNKLFIHLDGFNIFKTIDKNFEYHCENIKGMFVRKDQIVEELLAKETEKFELLGKVHFRGKVIDFDNLIIQSSSYEIPVKRVLEPYRRIQIAQDVNEIMCNSQRVLFMHCNSYSYLDYKKIDEMVEVDLSYLFEDSECYRVSDDLQWVAYVVNGTLYMAQLRGDKYECKDSDRIDARGKIVDIAFSEKSLLILQEKKLLSLDLEQNVVKEICSISGSKLEMIYSISCKGQYIILKNKRGKNIYINCNINEAKKDDFWDINTHIIKTSDNRSIYKAGYSTITIENVCDGSEEYLEGRNTDLSLCDLEYESNGYFFSMVRSGSHSLKNKRKIRVYRYISDRMAEVCDIGDATDIKKYVVHFGGMVTIDIDNNVTLWKMNG